MSGDEFKDDSQKATLSCKASREAGIKGDGVKRVKNIVARSKATPLHSKVQNYE